MRLKRIFLFVILSFPLLAQSQQRLCQQVFAGAALLAASINPGLAKPSDAQFLPHLEAPTPRDALITAVGTWNGGKIPCVATEVSKWAIILPASCIYQQPNKGRANPRLLAPNFTYTPSYNPQKSYQAV